MKLKSSLPKLQGKNLRIAIILARFNDEIGNELYNNTLLTLIDNGVAPKSIDTFRVPGALETPLASQMIAEKRSHDAIIVLGVVIRGDTYHFELVCQESYRGLMEVSLTYDLPVIFGILTVNTLEQALDRVQEKKMNKGKDFAEAALEMALLMAKK